MLDINWMCKIGDFGLSRFKEANKTLSSGGSPLWCAPELIRGDAFSESADVYSFGIICWEIMSWDEPHSDLNVMQVMSKVATDGLRPPINDNWNPIAKQLIQDCWQEDRELRPSFFECLQRIDSCGIEVMPGSVCSQKQGSVSRIARMESTANFKSTVRSSNGDGGSSSSDKVDEGAEHTSEQENETKNTTKVEIIELGEEDELIERADDIAKNVPQKIPTP
jgi:serine/threonine protein kinase